MRRHYPLALLALLTAGSLATVSWGNEPEPAAVDFSRDPGWEGFRNRLRPDRPRVTRQHFGYRPGRKAGGKAPGEVGGWVQRSITPAWYAMSIPVRTLDDRLTASGRFAVHRDDSSTGTLFGWFNDKASRGWRTPNSLALRIDGNGGKYWVQFEYCTRHWLSGGKGCYEGEAYQTTKTKPFPADGTPHDWSLTYDPEGNGGKGGITFVLDGTKYELPLADGHRANGATFNRFGVFNQQSTGDGMEVFFDDLVLDGKPVGFEQDPKWEAVGNDVEFEDLAVRPLQNFGHSLTAHSGGKMPGEIGGLIWRDERPAYYADAVGPFTLKDAFRASGRLAFTGAGSDSGVYVGWFNSAMKRQTTDVKGDPAQKNYLAVLLEGPSRIGHYFRPAYRAADGEGVTLDAGPVIRPDGEVHSWSIEYDPDGAGGNGRITVKLDEHIQTLDLRPGHKTSSTTFDRFGIFNHQSGGNYVYLYLDDLSYTHTPPARP